MPANCRRIHQKQVLALFGCVLPFAMVDELGWWAVPIVTLVIFTLYGIEGIGSQLEDPFGYDRNDIKMDAICQDANVELDVILEEWRKTTAAAEMAVKAETTPNGGSSEEQQQQEQHAENGGSVVVAAAAATPQVKYNPGDMFLRIRPSPRADN